MRGKQFLIQVFRLAFVGLVGLLSICSHSCAAQEKMLSYLVLSTNDTIYAEFERPNVQFGYQSQGNVTMAQKIILNDKRSGKTTDYDLDSISSFHLLTELGEEVYIPKDLNVNGFRGIDKFLVRELIKGPISLYEIRTPRPINSLDFNRKTDYKTLVLERGGFCNTVRPNKFRRDFSDFFYGDSELTSLIKNKELGFKDINEIVRRYNEFKSEDPDLVGYTNGYLVLHNGARLSGKIKVYDAAKSCRKINFCDESGQKLKIEKRLVKSYRRSNETFVQYRYILEEDTNVVFLLELVSGPISLYRLTTDLQVKYHKKLPTIEYGEVYKFYFGKEDEFTAIDEKNFHTDAAKYFSDAPELANKIEKRELGYNDLISILQIYAKEISQ